jgi:AP-1 complex subunit gamma-1
MSIKLRELIRNVRACKTAAEERAVIAKECALIRTAFKEEDVNFRHRNVAKLLFIHMLGYPSHFGQMECLKLIASGNFSEKRIGYLGLMLLLTEKEEVLMLVTNSLKNDLNNSNQFVAGLSLCAIGNVASSEIGRDLIPDVNKHLGSDNSYLRKKAGLSAIRIFLKVPDLIEDFTDRVSSMIKDRSHGVLVSGIQLIIEIIKINKKWAASFQRLVPNLVRLLRNLLSMGYAPEHDVSGIADPFLQVKILQVLQLLGHKNSESSDAMNDILAQVATNTETAKNAGNAILYECVQTIMQIESEGGLRVLAVNILGRFLLNRDNNIRYVALNTLSKIVSDDVQAVQRHRNTIVDCLKDPDISIRTRALDLIYSLANETNIRTLAREMLNYLVVCSAELKPDLCAKIADVVDRFAPSKRWQIDTLITTLSIAGNNLENETIASSLICLIAQCTQLHGYIVHKLFQTVTEDMTQQVALDTTHPPPRTRSHPTPHDARCDTHTIWNAFFCLGMFLVLIRHFSLLAPILVCRPLCTSLSGAWVSTVSSSSSLRPKTNLSRRAKRRPPRRKWST